MAAGLTCCQKRRDTHPYCLIALWAMLCQQWKLAHVHPNVPKARSHSIARLRASLEPAACRKPLAPTKTDLIRQFNRAGFLVSAMPHVIGIQECQLVVALGAPPTCFDLATHVCVRKERLLAALRRRVRASAYARCNNLGRWDR